MQHDLQIWLIVILLALLSAIQLFKITTELLGQIRPTAEQAAIVSRQQLVHADQVIEEVLEDVERINQGVHNVAAAVRFPFREAFALSAGIRSATATFFNRAGNSSKRKQC